VKPNRALNYYGMAEPLWHFTGLVFCWNIFPNQRS